jgi:hypothetical protein
MTQNYLTLVDRLFPQTQEPFYLSEAEQILGVEIGALESSWRAMRRRAEQNAPRLQFLEPIDGSVPYLWNAIGMRLIVRHWLRCKYRNDCKAIETMLCARLMPAPAQEREEG